MSRATTKGDGTFGAKAFLAFLTGAGVGLLMVAPVIPEYINAAILGLVQSGSTVIFAGIGALVVLVVLLVVVFQSFLS